MNRRIITLILAIATVCGGANAQWKQGDVPPSSRRGKIPLIEIDKAEVTVYFAFNAENIKYENASIDKRSLCGSHKRKTHFYWLTTSTFGEDFAQMDRENNDSHDMYCALLNTTKVIINETMIEQFKEQKLQFLHEYSGVYREITDKVLPL